MRDDDVTEVNVGFTVNEWQFLLIAFVWIAFGVTFIAPGFIAFARSLFGGWPFG